MNYRISALILTSFLSSCGFGHDEKLVSGYNIVAVDSNDQMSLCWKMENGDCNGDGLPGPTLFAAGYSEKFVVAAIHPHGNRSVTQYFYIVRNLKDERSKSAVHKFEVRGPFDEAQYVQQKAALHLPDFTHVFNDLK